MPWNLPTSHRLVLGISWMQKEEKSVPDLIIIIDFCGAFPLTHTLVMDEHRLFRLETGLPTGKPVQIHQKLRPRRKYWFGYLFKVRRRSM